MPISKYDTKGLDMKVINTDVDLYSSHSKHHEFSQKEELKVWNRAEDAPQRLRQMDEMVLSKDFLQLQQNETKLKELNDKLDEIITDPKLLQIILAIEALTGEKIDISFLKRFSYNNTDKTSINTHKQKEENNLLGWGIDYRYERHELFKESTNFSAQGKVELQNGESLEFSFALSINKEIHIDENISFKAGDALIDPLVINFGKSPLELSNITHSFDLDLDDKSDTFSFVANGSGFLALDKNNDGQINDGSELFGPKSGNGFKELSAYDTDNNHWIDENDEIYDKLLIWTKDENGEENLYTLRDKNIGAIYLKSVMTPFEYMDNNANTLAKMKQSSIYLKENGEVNSVHEIDLAI